ncbi:MAG: hypothetical protein QOH04_2065 [Sphingomonadales bacterium]|jgi:hypothetical protein|nr:hypothetical protein [Sphingomonadales bacterium]MEA3036300.1 hypothetical protein [Sphingomonadales bacterium]
MFGRLTLFALLLAGGCSSAKDEELAAAKGARSVLAEWSTVERLDRAGRLPRAYANEMREKAREAVLTDRKSIKDPDAGRTVDAVVSVAAPSARSLAAAGTHLQRAVDRLEAL